MANLGNVRLGRPRVFSQQFLLCRSLILVVGIGAAVGWGAGCDRGSTVNPPPVPPPKVPSIKADKGTEQAAPDDIRLTDMTAETGIQWEYQNGREAGNRSILESLGGGVGALDFDGDGRLDLFFPGGGGYDGQKTIGKPGGLFRNRGDWKFEEVSASAGGGFPSKFYSHGCFAADYDSDGFVDFLVTGYGGVQLWKNQGDGTFAEAAEATGLSVDKLWSSAAGWGDVNGDGHLDLYVAHYVNWSFENHPRCAGPAPGSIDICPPKVYEPLPDTLFLSDGEGRFVDGSEAAGLRKDGKGLGVVLGDVDRDGDLDIYVANDTTDNFLYLNDGHGVFQEVAQLAGVATDDRGTPNGSMGVDLGDYNLDGRPDIWVANFEVESFAMYRNDGHQQFLHVSQATGVTALNGLFVGFGTGFIDIDRDGDEDLVVTNGHVILFPRSAPLLQLPLLLRNEKGQRFRRIELKGPEYWTTPHAGRGVIFADLDNDGDMDMVFANNHEPAAVLRNDSAPDGQWLQVRLRGRGSNRDAIGAVLELETSIGKRVRLIKGGGTYLSQNDLRVNWGLPKGAQAQALVIKWPRGQEQRIEPVSLNQMLEVQEP